jgi:hypothetical protein
MGAFALAIPPAWIADWRIRRPWEALHTLHLADAA